MFNPCGRRLRGNEYREYVKNGIYIQYLSRTHLMYLCCTQSRVDYL